MSHKVTQPNPGVCPFCGEEELDAYDNDYGSNEIILEVYCMNCDAKFKQIFTYQHSVLDELP